MKLVKQYSQNFHNKELAEDTLAGMMVIDGFVFGYVETTTGDLFRSIGIFKCTIPEDYIEIKGQKIIDVPEELLND